MAIAHQRWGWMRPRYLPLPAITPSEPALTEPSYSGTEGQLLLLPLLAAFLAVEGIRELPQVAGQLRQLLRVPSVAVALQHIHQPASQLVGRDRFLPPWALLLPGLGDDLPCGSEGDFFAGLGLLAGFLPRLVRH